MSPEYPCLGRGTCCSILLMVFALATGQSDAVDLFFDEDVILHGGPFTFDDVRANNSSARLFILSADVTINNVLTENGQIFIANSEVNVAVLEVTGGGGFFVDSSSVVNVTGARRLETSRGGFPAVVYVDFSWAGPQDGTQANPFNTLAEGVSAVAAGGTVRVIGGRNSATAETFVINMAVTIIVVPVPSSTVGAVFGASGIESEFEGTGILEVNVVDEQAGLPITNATVSLRKSGSGPRLLTTNLGDGAYVATDLAPGFYDVIVVADGFEVGDKNVVAQNRGFSRIFFRLGVIDAGSTILADIPVSGTSAFLLVDRIDVFVSGTSTLVASSSEIDGVTYQVTNLNAGTFDVKAGSLSYLINTATVTLAADDTQSVSLTSNISVVPATIQGTVTNDDNPPVGIGDARVTASVDLVSTVVFDTTSVADGTYLLADVGVQTGSTSAIVQAEAEIDGVTRSSLADEIFIGPGDDVADIDLVIEMNSPLDVSVTLRDEFAIVDTESPFDQLSFAEASAGSTISSEEFTELDLSSDQFLDISELLTASVGPPGLATPVWVKFSYDAPEPEIGNEDRPFDSLFEGIHFVKQGGDVFIFPEVHPIPRPLVIDRPMRLRKSEGLPGSVLIGAAP